MLSDWVRSQSTPVGIGIDCVSISQLKELNGRTKGAFCARTFTRRERELAESAADFWEFLAGRFAVKEAVFKAAAHLSAAKTFDFRCVETLRCPDGSPEINMASIPTDILETAGIERLLVSITGEGDFALALVQACGKTQTEKV